MWHTASRPAVIGTAENRYAVGAGARRRHPETAMPQKITAIAPTISQVNVSPSSETPHKTPTAGTM